MQKIDWFILKRSVNGDLSEDERRELDAWIKASGDNERYYRKMEKFFIRGQKREIDVSRNFKRFVAQAYGRRRRVVRNILKYAAAVVFFVGGVVFLQEMKFGSDDANGKQAALAPGMGKAVLYTGSGQMIALENREQRDIIIVDSLRVEQDHDLLNYEGIETSGKVVDEMHSMRVPRGGEFSMKLSDGTMVYLNAETNLRYPIRFNWEERRVKLSGEAYFDVMKSDKPFIVEVDGFEVKVLGTRFNIQAYGDETRFKTTLEQGSVEVHVEGNKMLLEPGEQAVLTKDGELTKRKVDVSLYTAWKDGNLVFEDERLEDVMNTVARWYDIKVFYTNQDVKNVRINGNICRFKDFSVLLEKIEKLDIVHFEIKENVITVTSK